MSRPRRHSDDLRGLAQLAVTATSNVTDVVEEMHRAIASGPAVLGEPLSGPVRALLPFVYDRIRDVTGVVGSGIDLVLSQLDRVLGESAPGAERDAVLAALNGVVGDYLERTQNPLATTMSLRSENVALSLEAHALAEQLPAATEKVVVLVHGLSMNDRQWRRSGHDHGAELARDLGYTPVYVRYNSGRHISENGRALSDQLEALAQAWPVPMSELVLLGHSMGGLVARSACHAASVDERLWLSALRHLICLGSPHHGSPIERGGNLFEVLLGVTRYSAPIARLGRLRSAGVTDLRYGNVIEADWKDHDRFRHGRDVRRSVPLPENVGCFAIAGELPNATAQKLFGDGLVPVDSALGRHRRPEVALKFPAEHQWVARDTGHLELLSSTAVYDKLRGWLA